VVKIAEGGRLKTTERTERGSSKDVESAAQAFNPSVRQPRRAKLHLSGGGLQQQNQNVYIPVVSREGKPLMPSKASRIRKWIKNGKAIKRWSKGLFYVQLTVEVEENVQPIVVTIDPGSKWEGFTVKSEAHTYFNLQTEAVTWVSKRVEVRANMRRGRRFRKTPCREPRSNRSKRPGWLAPSTHARWQFKLNVVKRLGKMYPLCHSVVEDIKAKT
jgi:hypothetical protein